jgi:cytosine/adenosine deaminase-related metal-dependent hydrolase
LPFSAAGWGGKFTLSQAFILYRKFKPTVLFNGQELMPAGTVLVTDREGTIVEFIHEREAGDDIEVLDGILSPGFINAHCHIELSHMKGLIPEHTGLVRFVQQVMQNRNAATTEVRATSMQAAEDELYQSGTVAIGDICNGTESLFLKQRSKLYWHNFIEVSGFVDNNAKQRLAAAEDVMQAFQASFPLLGNTLAAHAPYSVSKELFRLLNDKTAGQITSIHNQEAAAENELYLQKTGDFLKLYENFGIDITGFSATGKTSLQSWLPYFDRGQQMLAVHNSFTSGEELEELDTLRKSTGAAFPGIHFCICINANLYIENRLPPLDLLIKNNVNIVLGTDSYASNRQLNMMEEIRSIKNHFPHIPLPVILRWATFNGAKALRIDERFGSFEPGKKPGLVLIDEKNFTAKLLLP